MSHSGRRTTPAAVHRSGSVALQGPGAAPSPGSWAGASSAIHLREHTAGVS